MKHTLVLSGVELAAASPLLKRVIGKNAVLPILEDVLVDVRDGIRLITTDLENTVICHMEQARSEDIGWGFAIPAQHLLSIKTKDSVSFVFDTETLNVEIQQGAIRRNVACESADDYPRIPAFEDSIKLLTTDKTSMFTDALGFVGRDDLRPAMTGVCVDVTEKKGKLSCHIVATDAHKLYKYTATEEIMLVSPYPRQIIIPHTLIPLYDKLTMMDIIVDQVEDERIKKNKKGEKMTTGKDKRYVYEKYMRNANIKVEGRVKYGGSSLQVQLISRLIDAMFPNYDAVIPIDNPVKLKIQDVEEFMMLVKEAIKCSNKTTHQVNLKLNGVVHISSHNLDFATHMSCEVPNVQPDTSKVEGGIFEIGCNGEFLTAVIKNIKTPVTIEMSTPSRAMIFKGSDKNLLALLMPVMVNA